MIWIVLAFVVAYLIGSVPGGLVLGRMAGIDLRAHGSGNAGATNAVRAKGMGFGAAVFAFDAAKGILAVVVLPYLVAAPFPGLEEGCAGAVILGHVFPVWFRFRGGKGFATALGAILILSPLALVVVVGVWVVLLVLTGYVSAATLCGAVAFPVYVALAGHGRWTPLLLFSIALALFLVFTHRTNVMRLVWGNENRFYKVWLFGRGRR
ncbi:MAG TPA: glycerol-3-phosphate 1-O-acyltransferase PlsY [Gammaproteobacteria bacterium]|nr:glycerol-3-phosphate 1-O-acyltransferase PlsY [Gammaproteobacteria bacterium]